MDSCVVMKCNNYQIHKQQPTKMCQAISTLLRVYLKFVQENLILKTDVKFKTTVTHN